MQRVCSVLRRVFDRYFWICFGLCFLMAMAVFLPRIISGGGAFSIYSDYNYQQIPFSMSLHRTIHECGVDCWVDSLDLGTSSIQGYSFYELGSPFFWLMVPFPTETVPYLMGWIYMLKYAVAGATAFMFLRRFIKKPRNAILAAILYAFSGFQATNLMFGHFHDVVAFFPLLMIGLERLAENPKKKKFFILMIALNCVVNYFFFIQEIVFLLMYVVVRFWNKGFKWIMRFALRCFLCGLFGILLSAAIFLPSALYISSSSRAEGIISTEWVLQNLPDAYVLIARGMLFPADAMTSHASIVVSEYDSASCWLPMIGLSLVFAYLLKERKWLSVILVLCLLGSFTIIFPSLFLLLKVYYLRWWYMLTLLSALASGLVLDDLKKYRFRLGAFINMVMVFATLVWIYFGTDLDIMAESRFIPQVIFALSGCLLTILAITHRKIFSVLIVLFAVGSTMLTFYYYVEDGEPVRDYVGRLEAKSKLTLPDDRYRTSSNENEETIATGLPGMSSFSSTVSHNIVRFDEIFVTDDDYNPVERSNKSLHAGLTELLGGKYDIVEEDGAVRFEERPACPIGYAVDSYMTYDELLALPMDERAYAMLKSVAVRNDEETSLKHVVPSDFSYDGMFDDIDKNVSRQVKSFSRVRDGYDIETDYVAEEYVYFTIPNESGWRIIMDNTEKIETIDSAGMMIMKIPAGEHKITMRYHTPWYSVGVMLSVLAWLGFGFWVVLDISHGFGMRRR